MPLRQDAIALVSVFAVFFPVAASSAARPAAFSDNVPSIPSNSSESGTAPAPVSASAMLVQARPEPAPDPCTQKEVVANATRPAWDYAAATTQCGILETDYGFLRQPLGAGVAQRALATSVRYGLTPRLDLRWAIANHIWQGGGGTRSLEGAGDQWLGARYRFHEQGRFAPAMAFLYTSKLPLANPAKGLGTGYVDHQFVFIASRDLGKNHFDFNTVGTLAGNSRGHDGAAQFGLALTRPITPKFSGILESYGGGQPGTSARFGAAFAGVTYAPRPQLVLDGAFSRTYTAGSPRQQILFGFTYARRSGFAPFPRRSSLARILGQ